MFQAYIYVSICFHHCDSILEIYILCPFNSKKVFVLSFYGSFLLTRWMLKLKRYLHLEIRVIIQVSIIKVFFLIILSQLIQMILWSPPVIMVHFGTFDKSIGSLAFHYVQALSTSFDIVNPKILFNGLKLTSRLSVIYKIWQIFQNGY